MSLSVDIEKKLGAFHLRSQFEAPDETMALLGASGCGKSMTAKRRSICRLSSAGSGIFSSSTRCSRT